MQTISIDFTVPQGWHELGDKQLRYVCRLLAQDYDADELRLLCLLRWSGTKIIGKQADGSWLLKKGDTLFEATSGTLAALLPHLDWLTALPTVPVRLSRFNRREAVAADFQGVAFGDYIVADNLYQGYLQTQDASLLDAATATLYGKELRLNDEERVSVFYWQAGLKALFAAKWPDFFTPLATDEQRQFADHETDA